VCLAQRLMFPLLNLDRKASLRSDASFRCKLSVSLNPVLFSAMALSADRRVD
jgi:hypothetical protein